MNNSNLTLSTICGGTVQSKLDRAFAKVAQNILDENTDQTKKRSITLKIVFEPNEEDPETVLVTANVKTALVPERDSFTQLYLQDEGEDGIMIREYGMNPKTGEIIG